MGFVIRYDSRSTVNGQDVGTVYVVGPLPWSEEIGKPVFSYTKDVDEASVWDDREDAERATSHGHWANVVVLDAAAMREP